MKKNVLIVAATMLLISLVGYSQNGKAYWQSVSAVQNRSAVVEKSKLGLIQPKLYELDIKGFKALLANSPKRVNESSGAGTTVSFPDADGTLQTYSVFENSTMDPALAAKYPDIKSYVGKGTTDPTAMIYFSVSPLGLQTMLLRADKECVIIEPFTKDQSTYAVYKKSDRTMSLSRFECKVIGQAKKQIGLKGAANRPNADDGILRTYRLALSANGEYTQYFGGTVAGALAAMNASMTRVNGIFENDFAIRMVIIANTNLLIYTNPATDPYNTFANDPPTWNTQLQDNLDALIGNANYDIGHLFGTDPTAGGNAGCVGCVCEAGTKGRGFTAFAEPVGDVFDIDFLSHEFGHQFGASHTFTYQPVLEGSIAQVEPGSGVTIMSYAGYTDATDILPHPYPYFHSISVQQVTDNIKTKTCQVNTPTGNATPTAIAGPDYIIPKGTPFTLSGVATDANDASLLYNWEQIDVDLINNTPYPSPTDVSGPEFRNFNLSTNNTRTFPELATVLAGATSSLWEAVPNVARTLNFRFIVRDNHAGGSANNSDDVVVTTAASGPFVVSVPNTAVNWAGSSSQTVTWAVAGTTGAPVSCANVKISLSTDGGLTFPTVLLASTPNDGSQSITVPNVTTTTARIKVEAVGNIFFDLSNANFSITAAAGTYTITASAGTGGVISPNGEVSVTSGANKTFTITPNSCYKISDVKVDGVSQGAITTYAFSNVTATHTISATFSQLTYTITASAGTGGSISSNGATNVNCGANKTYTITPNSGYAVQSVIVDGVSKGAVTTYTFSNVTAPHTISASFTNGCTTPATPGPISGQSTNLCGGGNFTYSIAAVPGATSYIWSVSGNSACTISGSTTLPTVTIRLASYFYGTVSLSVKAKSACGTSLPRTLVLSDEPAAPASISGPSTVSKNQSNLVYQVPYTPGVTYYWSVDGGTITSKPTPYKIVVKWGKYKGEVKVKVRNNCGYSPWIEKKVNVSSTSHDAEYEMSNPVTEIPYIRAYPNPATNNAAIVFNSKTAAKKFKVEVRDITGKLISTKAGAANEGINIQKLDVSKYAASVYIVTLSLEGEKPRALKLFKAN